ncbi:hypothetical protein LZ30DRAFT_340148 [Colletotrichum cereale]|nr:hypothetical protein LZ30DRAFT_340148 [Colletotrichum cereale]
MWIRYIYPPPQQHNSSGVERWAHNPEVPGSKPGCATDKLFCPTKLHREAGQSFLLASSVRQSVPGLSIDSWLGVHSRRGAASDSARAATSRTAGTAPATSDGSFPANSDAPIPGCKSARHLPGPRHTITAYLPYVHAMGIEGINTVFFDGIFHLVRRAYLW